MRSSLTLVTRPTLEPVTLAELKLAARIDGEDEDPLLQVYIATAREAAEVYTKRAFLTQTWRMTFDLPASGLDCELGDGVYDLPITALYGGLPRVIPLLRPQILTIASVKTYDTDNTETTFSSDNYTLDTAGGRLILKNTASWPSNLRQQAAIVIEYTAGYGPTVNTTPQAIRTAIMMHAQRMYDSRIMCELPEDCQRLLRPYRIMDM